MKEKQETKNEVSEEKEVKENKMKSQEPKKEEVKEMPESIEESEVKKDEKIGIAYIYSSSNNTQVHITDLAGNTLSRISGGMMTKHSRLKADPTVAMFVAKKASERAKDLGINALYVRTRAKTGSPGLGSGTHAAVKSLGKEGFRIISILDTTRVPRGGPKKKGGKRG
ncbi:MAG: 30S ribosomal protein S11, partial [Nanoarchaeota archaeon]